MRVRPPLHRRVSHKGETPEEYFWFPTEKEALEAYTHDGILAAWQSRERKRKYTLTVWAPGREEPLAYAEFFPGEAHEDAEAPREPAETDQELRGFDPTPAAGGP